jgi:hypothetical protein
MAKKLPYRTIEQVVLVLRTFPLLAQMCMRRLSKHELEVVACSALELTAVLLVRVFQTTVYALVRSPGRMIGCSNYGFTL